MKEKNSLLEAYKQSKYQLVGHGPRNGQVLKEAFKDIDGHQESDIYGTGKVIGDFEEKMAKYLGKKAAVFFPSGTMAQQIALRMWCDNKGIKRVAYHPLCHLEIREEDGLKELHHIETILLADENRVIELEDVMGMKEDISCLLLELPQREIGGQLPDYKTLEAISKYCGEKGIKLHLDGARLYEVLPYYKKSASEVCELFDSVYVSFYKGIGGVAGSILAGDEAFIKESKIWKKRYGGDLISLYPYIISADYYFNRRIDKMDQYYEEAKELAELFNKCDFLTIKPLKPVSNMFHVYFDVPKEKLEPVMIEVFKETGIGLTNRLNDNKDGGCYCEISTGDNYENIPKEEIKKALKILDSVITEII